VRRIAIFATGLLILTSCQATRSWEEGCPGVYSGARYYADITPTVPFDGKVFFTLDLIPTLLVDTLALPVTAFADPKRPTGGYVIGCRWADSRRER
jgi:uncharacterized protein YceK